MRAGATLAVLLLSASAGAQPGNVHHYTIDAAASEVTAKVAFFGLASKTARFPHISGGIALSPDAPERIDLKVTLDATALTAPDRVTLARLKGPDFFDVAHHPTITFAGSEMSLGRDRTATVPGQITARGVTRPARLVVSFDKPPGRAAGREPLTLTAETRIDRRDFGMTAYPLIVGRTVTIRIRARMNPD